MTWISNQQLVEERGARAPVAQNKYRVLRNGRPTNSMAPKRFLEQPASRVNSAKDANDARDPPISGVDGKSVFPEHPAPTEQAEPLPHMRSPFSIFGCVHGLNLPG